MLRRLFFGHKPNGLVKEAVASAQAVRSTADELIELLTPRAVKDDALSALADDLKKRNDR